MKTRGFMILVISISLLSGCATVKGYPDRSGNLTADLQELNRYFDPKIIDQYNNAPQKKEFRDEVVYGRIRAIDLHFAKFQQNLVREDFLGRVASRWTVLGLTAAIATGPGAGASAVLGAISTGITGAWETIDQKTFIKETIPILLAKMESLRKETMVKIMGGLQKGAEDYPLNQALIDVENYYRAGTLPGALIGIAETAGATAKKADEEIKEILIGKYVKDPAGEIIFKFWKTDGKNPNKDNQTELENWLKNKEDIPIIYFIKTEKFAKLREEAVNDLDLPREVDEPISKKLRNYWKPDNVKPDIKWVEKLDKWMQNKYKMKIPIKEFLYKNEYSDKRKEATDFFKQ